MNFRFAELVETKEFQYVRIHKNGNKSVMNCILDTYKDNIQYTFGLSKKPRFCIIRDPYERFLSGLNYDLIRHNLNFSDIKLNELFNGKVNLHTRSNGDINHCISQFSHIINVNIDFYVHINDLEIFLKMHFGESQFLNLNPEKFSLDIEKKDVMKYLNFDYYMYNQILNSDNLWKWNQGKLF